MNLEVFNRVLVLAPHTDDGELGAGATIAKLIEHGADVRYVAFSAAEDSVPVGFHRDVLREEVLLATSSLGIDAKNVSVLNYPVRKFSYSRQNILEDLVKERNAYRPDLVIMPCLDDVHQDHFVVAQEALRSFKRTTILCYELVWNNLNFGGNTFIMVEEKHVNSKIMALSKYKSQEGRDYMSADFIRSLARVRGVSAGKEYVECFEVVRWFIS